MKSLEIYTGQEIQSLQKRIVKRFEMFVEIIGTHEQGKKYKDRLQHHHSDGASNSKARKNPKKVDGFL